MQVPRLRTFCHAASETFFKRRDGLPTTILLVFKIDLTFRFPMLQHYAAKSLSLLQTVPLYRMRFLHLVTLKFLFHSSQNQFLPTWSCYLATLLNGPTYQRCFTKCLNRMQYTIKKVQKSNLLLAVPLAILSTQVLHSNFETSPSQIISCILLAPIHSSCLAS